MLVTGASSGIGLETAVYLAERGFQVYAGLRNVSRRDRLDAEARRRGVQLDVIPLDVTDEADIQTAVGTIVARAGGIYGLVNNAGIALRGFFEDLADAEIRQVFATNVFGTMAVTRAVLPHMRAARQGRIVIVTSVGGRSGSFALSAYCAAKFALEGFGESLALELSPLGIQVTLVEPGIIKTEIWGANRGIAKGALDPHSAYAARFNEAERLVDWLVASSPTKPVDVARAVHRALTVERAGLRYLVGWRTRLVLAAERYLPGKLYKRLIYDEALRRATKVGQSLTK